jgi:Mg2+ and Co2+ transporter CorA
MHCFIVTTDQFTELAQPPAELPARGFLWIAAGRREFEVRQHELQGQLAGWAGAPLVDLHVADLLNNQLPSHHDYTSTYDLLVFRRLAAQSPGGSGKPGSRADGEGLTGDMAQLVDTSPVGFAAFDRVLLTVHPVDCAVREHFSRRLRDQHQASDARGAGRLPSSPADLMLRMVNHMVDGYLELRRLLTRRLGLLQKELLDPRSRFSDWQVLLDSRNGLHLLEDVCEDQQSAIQEWIDALDEWPAESDPERAREREVLRVRSRDALEHVERVLAHVRRLEQSTEVAVQMHFSALANRTNDIMRTLTVLTAVFLPLNLITGFFGMNFDSLPLIHSDAGVWIAAGMMVTIAVVLGALFRRNRYLGSSRRR